MQIDMEQINCFLEVARLLSFTKAADVLYMSQPAVSRKISALESRLNVTLIQRGKRDIGLTDAGVEFRQLFEEYRTRLYSLQQRHAALSAGRIAFGVFHGCDIMDGMGNFIAEFQAVHTGIDLWGTSADSSALIDGLHTGQFDFAVGLKEPFAAEDDLTVKDIGTVRRMVVYAKENPLANKPNLKLEDFAEQPYYAFIDEKTPMELRTKIRKICCGDFPTRLLRRKSRRLPVLWNFGIATQILGRKTGLTEIPA